MGEGNKEKGREEEGERVGKREVARRKKRSGGKKEDNRK